MFPAESSSKRVTDVDVEVVVDFVADVGDGLVSTRSVANALMREPRADWVIFGGDLTYPYMAEPFVSKRFLDLYDNIWESLHKNTGSKAKPHASLLIGNHDFFDNCDSFRELCVKTGTLGPWELSNGRSSCFVHQIHSWVFVGVTFNQLDDLQRSEVERVIDKIREMDCSKDGPSLRDFVLIGHRPFWLLDDAAMRQTRQPNLDELLTFLEASRKLRLCLAGDLHNFTHHVAPSPNSKGQTHFMVAGGGGAFLHPPGRTIPRHHATQDDVQAKMEYPGKETTWWIRAKSALLVPIRQPFLTVAVAAIPSAWRSLGFGPIVGSVDLDAVQVTVATLLLFSLARACVSRLFAARQLRGGSDLYEFLVAALCIVAGAGCCVWLFLKVVGLYPFLYTEWCDIFDYSAVSIEDKAHSSGQHHSSFWFVVDVVILLSKSIGFVICFWELIYLVLMFFGTFLLYLLRFCVITIVFGCYLSVNCAYVVHSKHDMSTECAPEHIYHCKGWDDIEGLCGEMSILRVGMYLFVAEFVGSFACYVPVYLLERMRCVVGSNLYERFVRYPAKCFASPFIQAAKFYQAPLRYLVSSCAFVGGLVVLHNFDPLLDDGESLFRPFFVSLWLYRTIVSRPLSWIDTNIASALAVSADDVGDGRISSATVARDVVWAAMIISCLSCLFAVALHQLTVDTTSDHFQLFRTVDEGFFASFRNGNYKNFLRMTVSKSELKVFLRYRDDTDDSPSSDAWKERSVVTLRATE
uniref:Calcineurin-like phosphoesterase domain-containing protein n=1 Tax=Sexangularia sp. CB-2014 TaxID=1486929 RepID=A0A7S1YAI7_9EUKA|mmetsp:Transcript_11207/g.35592  ORF Transcript_11207/g.35592 Transcript_11207/m.35592 type:complete len:749 (+) Transcript_11207:813-3059(+)|eukprot:CAMPEP_0170737742 /NCGR_PEP_ID=MMETSP0437-20130122/4283_1 /TAXON_ID=0 /ORGANISM="Sexangularia sp." /LENGTH=748 /DNA_ID=CAMNT_0011076137 /DNA_START=696 /DNA_END=2942 /DNA_ORIENTATION=+